MTYNFDPDRWYQNHRAALEARRARDEIGDASLAEALVELERRYQDMLDRLTGSFTGPELGNR